MACMQIFFIPSLLQSIVRIASLTPRLDLSITSAAVLERNEPFCMGKDFRVSFSSHQRHLGGLKYPLRIRNRSRQAFVTTFLLLSTAAA
ncbi:hypothetical protein NPIL_374531 [Nephila pilipes]|uniref:Uncharacterized protein n=1 Tax=Nephila pilipes TaxID=299642 RepID=A0A8X6N3I7_NEPPI|nr:hypothetical protein NPIL_374531 [Nephila pilipes]